MSSFDTCDCIARISARRSGAADVLAALAGLGEEGLEVIANGAVAHVRRATGPPAPRHPARPITDRRPQGVPLVARDPDTSCRQRLRGGDVVNERPQQK